MYRVFLSLGSNVGDSKDTLEKAIIYLQTHTCIQNVVISSFYKTEPVGYQDQNWFINCVVGCMTRLDPHHLLDYCQQIETLFKKNTPFRNGPRTLDIDILTYENRYLKSDRLQLPHPRMLERAFVMVPLLELAIGIDFKDFSKHNQWIATKNQALIKL